MYKNLLSKDFRITASVRLSGDLEMSITEGAERDKGVFLEEEQMQVVKESLSRHSRDCKKSSLARIEKARARVGREWRITDTGRDQIMEGL